MAEFNATCSAPFSNGVRLHYFDHFPGKREGFTANGSNNVTVSGSMAVSTSDGSSPTMTLVADHQQQRSWLGRATIQNRSRSQEAVSGYTITATPAGGTVQPIGNTASALSPGETTEFWHVRLRRDRLGRPRRRGDNGLRSRTSSPSPRDRPSSPQLAQNPWRPVSITWGRVRAFARLAAAKVVLGSPSGWSPSLAAAGNTISITGATNAGSGNINVNFQEFYSVTGETCAFFDLHAGQRVAVGNDQRLRRDARDNRTVGRLDRVQLQRAVRKSDDVLHQQRQRGVRVGERHSRTKRSSDRHTKNALTRNRRRCSYLHEVGPRSDLEQERRLR